MKRYITPLIVAAVAIAMTVFKSPHAYNLAKFASPALLVLIWIGYMCIKGGYAKIPPEPSLPKRFIMVFYLLLVVLLASFGHGWLALCWSFIWLGAFLNRQAFEEKLKKMGAET